jgi:hypothetical protein
MEGGKTVTESWNQGQPEKASVPEQTAKPATEPGPAGVPPTGSSTMRIDRTGLWQRVRKTWGYVDRSDKDVKIRVDDKRSIQVLIASVILLVASVALMAVNRDLRIVSIGLGLLADFMTFVALLWYVALRFGTLGALEPRHAVLCFQLAIGTGILSAFFAINMILALFAFT